MREGSRQPVGDLAVPSGSSPLSWGCFAAVPAMHTGRESRDALQDASITQGTPGEVCTSVQAETVPRSGWSIRRLCGVPAAPGRARLSPMPLSCPVGTAAGSGGDSTAALWPAPPGAGWRGVLRCSPASGRAGGISSVISALHPFLPSPRSLQPEKSPDGCHSAPHTSWAGSAQGVSFLQLPATPRCDARRSVLRKRPRLCTDTIALARLFQPPAAVAGSQLRVVPTPPSPHPGTTGLCRMRLHPSPPPGWCHHKPLGSPRFCCSFPAPLSPRPSTCPSQQGWLEPVPHRAPRAACALLALLAAFLNCKRHPIFWKLS